MGKKRILVYAENYLPSIGGLENNTDLLCSSLSKLGYNTTLLTPQIDAKSTSSFLVIESRSVKLFYQQVKQHDFILVNGGVSFKMIIPCLMAFKPYVIIYQMATLYKDTRNNSLKTKILNILRKYLAFFAKVNVGVSIYSFEALKDIFGTRKARLLINPADPIFIPKNQHLNKNRDVFQCMIAGRLIEGKGIKLLIESVKHINQKQIRLHLHVIGDGPEKEYVEENTLSGFIFYHAPVSKEEMRTWLSKIHLTIIPSTSHIEGSPLLLAESLAMHVPVLVSSQPAMMASVQNEHLIFRSGDLANLKSQLIYLLNNKHYQAAQKHCKVLSENYNYPNYLNHLKLILDV